MRFASGVTDQYIYFVAVDATDLKTRETGLSSFTVYRSRNGGAAASYTTPTINETDQTNMPGVYELLLDEDMTIDSGDETQAVCLHITQASMAPVTLQFELYRPKITAGETLTVSSGNGNAAVQSIANNAITAASIATGAIDADAIADNAIDAGAIATGAITSAKFAAGAIDAAAIAANAIGASELATDAVTEIVDAVWANASRTLSALDEDSTTIDLDAAIRAAVGLASADLDTQLAALPTAAENADAVWDEDATGHQTGGTFGQAIGDPGASTETLFKAIITDPAGTNIAADIIAIKAETAAIVADSNELQTDWADGGRLDLILDARASQTSVDDLPTNAELTTALGTADDAVLAQVALVKTETDKIAAIKTQTDKFTFTIANQVDANIQYVNDVQVNGTGAAGAEWGP